MVKKVSLTDSEWQIIKLLWDNAPLTIAQMEKLLKDTKGWSRHALISLLKRMQTKETITVEDDGKAKRFFPAITKDDAYVTETQTFLSKLYNGKIGLMLSSMADNEELNDEDIKELSDILNKLKEGGGATCLK